MKKVFVRNAGRPRSTALPGRLDGRRGSPEAVAEALMRSLACLERIWKVVDEA